MVLIYLTHRLPFPTAGLPGWKIAMVIGFPAGHDGNGVRRLRSAYSTPPAARPGAASIRREEASQFVAPTGSLNRSPRKITAGAKKSPRPAIGQARDRIAWPSSGPLAFRHALRRATPLVPASPMAGKRRPPRGKVPRPTQ